MVGLHGRNPYLYQLYVERLHSAVSDMLPNGTVIEILPYTRIRDLPVAKTFNRDWAEFFLWTNRIAVGKVSIQYSPAEGYEVYVDRGMKPGLSAYW